MPKCKNYFLQELYTGGVVNLVLLKRPPMNTHKFLKDSLRKQLKQENAIIRKNNICVAETTLEQFETIYRSFGIKPEKFSHLKRTNYKNKVNIRKRVLSPNERHNGKQYIYGLIHKEVVLSDRFSFHITIFYFV